MPIAGCWIAQHHALVGCVEHEVRLTPRAAAIGAHEAEMRSFAYPLIAITVDHDNVFGGGALARSESAA